MAARQATYKSPRLLTVSGRGFSCLRVRPARRAISGHSAAPAGHRCGTLRRQKQSLMILSRRLVTLQTGRCPTEPLSRLRRQLPFQESLYGVLMPPLKREVPAVRAVGFANEEFGDSNLWFPNSSIEPAAASGSGHCPAATPTSNPQGILRIRRNQPLQCMAAGFVCYPAAAGGSGHCPTGNADQ